MEFTARDQGYPVEYVPAAGYAAEFCGKHKHEIQARASGVELKWMRNEETVFVVTFHSNVISIDILQEIDIVK